MFGKKKEKEKVSERPVNITAPAKQGVWNLFLSPLLELTRALKFAYPIILMSLQLLRNALITWTKKNTLKWIAIQQHFPTLRSKRSK